MKQIDIQIHPVGRKCQVRVDGEDIPCKRFVITADINDITHVDLTCMKTTGEPYELRGYIFETDHQLPNLHAVRVFRERIHEALAREDIAGVAAALSWYDAQDGSVRY